MSEANSCTLAAAGTMFLGAAIGQLKSATADVGAARRTRKCGTILSAIPRLQTAHCSAAQSSAGERR